MKCPFISTIYSPWRYQLRAHEQRPNAERARAAAGGCTGSAAPALRATACKAFKAAAYTISIDNKNTMCATCAPSRAARWSARRPRHPPRSSPPGPHCARCQCWYSYCGFCASLRCDSCLDYDVGETMTVYYCDAYFRVFYYTSLVWKNCDGRGDCVPALFAIAVANPFPHWLTV